MGMLKEGVRLDRVRGGRQKYRRVTPYTTPASAANATAQSGSTDSNANSLPVKKVSLEGIKILKIDLHLRYVLLHYYACVGGCISPVLHPFNVESASVDMWPSRLDTETNLLCSA